VALFQYSHDISNSLKTGKLLTLEYLSSYSYGDRVPWYVGVNDPFTSPRCRWENCSFGWNANWQGTLKNADSG
jgi:hypothetical protein